MYYSPIIRILKEPCRHAARVAGHCELKPACQADRRRLGGIRQQSVKKTGARAMLLSDPASRRHPGAAYAYTLIRL